MKNLPRNEDGKSIDPFSPENRDKDLIVSRISPTHTMMMNKYPIMIDHALIVTDKLFTQRSLLDDDDFNALLYVQRVFPAFQFYNCGPEAGASQYHKHLQCIPMDSLALQQDPAVPIDTAINRYVNNNHLKSGDFFNLPEYSFHHSFCLISDVINNPSISINDGSSIYICLKI